MPITVLSYGHDPLLLQTRDQILSHEGFRVTNAIEISQACQILARHSVDLLLLCHTLSEQEFQTILTAAHALRSPPSILTLNSNAFGSLARGKESVFDASNGPQKLLAAIRVLIGSNRVAVLHQSSEKVATQCRDTQAQ